MRFSDSVTYSQHLHEKFKTDSETYEEIISGKRSDRFKKRQLKEAKEESVMPNFEVFDYDGVPSDLNFRVYLTKLDPKEINFSLDFENY